MTFEVGALEELEIPARWLLKNYPNGGLFFLRGDLASGKTSFVKAFSAILGFNEAHSPTFTIMNEYGGKIFHYDLYQLEEKQISLFEIAETFCESGWHFVEWANEDTAKIADVYGLKPVWNDFCVKNGKRQIKIK